MLEVHKSITTLCFPFIKYTGPCNIQLIATNINHIFYNVSSDITALTVNDWFTQGDGLDDLVPDKYIISIEQVQKKLSHTRPLIM